MTARREGMWVDKMDVSVTWESLEAWSAKQNINRERVKVFWFMLRKGMVDEGMLNEFLQQMRTM